MRNILVLVVLVGSAFCEPPVALSYGGYAASPVAPVAYPPTSLLALSESLISPGSPQSLLVAAPQAQSYAYAAPQTQTYAYAAPQAQSYAYAAPKAQSYVYAAPAATYGAPVSAYGAPAYAGPVATYGAPAVTTLNAGFALGDYAAPVVKAPVVKTHTHVYQAPSLLKSIAESPVFKASVGLVKSKPIVHSHHYDHAPFQPIIKKPVYGVPAYKSSYSITPSISYGYSYKLVPTSHYGPTLGHVPKKVVAPVFKQAVVKGPILGGGRTKTFDLSFGLDLGHRPERHHQHHHHNHHY